MMTIEEMNEAKKKLHYTNEMISQKSGVPLPTVQKVLSGTTAHPRYKTLVALEAVFKRADAATTDTTYPFEGEFELSEEGLPIHPRYRIPIRRQGDYTTDDLDRIPDDIRVELIDGVIYDLASPTSIHQVIIGTVYTIMGNYAAEQGYHCMPYIAPLDVKFDLSKRTKVQPDLLVVCENDKKDKFSGDDSVSEEPNPEKAATVQAPDFIMEVLSPSSRRVDMLIKLNKYYEVGVREYWIVDPADESVIVYDFENDKLNVRYSFDDAVPVAISGGDLKIDFRTVQERLQAAERIEKSKPWEMLLR